MSQTAKYCSNSIMITHHVSHQENEDLPSLSNAIGSVGTLPDVVDVSSFIVSPLISGTILVSISPDRRDAPMTIEGRNLLIGCTSSGTSMLTMRLGGHELGLSRFRWSAYETTRVSVPVHVGCHILTTTSSLRMLHSEAALLWEVSAYKSLFSIICTHVFNGHTSIPP
jgi:hypothetical protein